MNQKTVPKNKLQTLYDTACWYGYAVYKGMKLFRHDLLKIAKEKGVKLEFPTVH